MASNEIVFKVKVQKDGNLKVVAKEAEKAAKGTDKLGKSTDKLEKKRSRYHKAEKGVGQAGLSSAKSFSKMNQTMGGSGGLVAAYAVLAANIFALTAAFGALSRAAQVEKLKEGMIAMGQSTGIAMNALSRGLVEATGYAISLEEAMRTTAQVTSAGFDPSVIERLGNVARMASQALGRDLNDAMQRITRGAVKMEPELLDELGIMVRLDEATETYANQLGRTASDLTNFEKRQAFMNAVLTEGERKFAALGDVDVNPYSQLAATFKDLTDTFLGFINIALKPLVTVLGGSGTLLTSSLLIFASTAGKMVGPLLDKLVNKMDNWAISSGIAREEMVKTIAATGTGSKKVIALKEAIVSTGKASSTEWASGLKGARQSVIGHTTALKNNIATHGLFSKASWQSSVSIHAARNEHYQLIKAKAALSVADLFSVETTSFHVLANEGLRLGLAALKVELASVWVAYMGNTAGTTLLAKAKLFLAASATIAGRALMFSAAAILANLIPLALLIAASYAAYKAIQWLIEWAQSDQENALAEQVEASATALEDLKTNLEEVDAAFAGTSDKITTVTGRFEAMHNIMSQVTSDYGKMSAAQKEANANVSFMGSLMKRIGLGPGNAQLDFVNQLLDSSEHLKTEFMKIAEDNGLAEAFKNGTIEGGQLDTIMSQLEDRSAKLNTTFAAFADAIEGVSQPTQEFFASLAEKTTVDKMVASFDNLELAMSNLGEETAQDFVAGFADKASPELLKMVGIDAKTMKNAALHEDTAKEAKKRIQKTLPLIIEIFKTEKARQLLHKQEVKTLKARLSLTKHRAGIEGQAALGIQIQRELQKKTVEDLEGQIAMQKRLLEQKGEDANITAKINSLEEEKSTIQKMALTAEDEALAVAKESETILKHRMDVEQERLGILNKITAGQKTLNNLEMEAESRAIRNANRKDYRFRDDPSATATQKIAARAGKGDKDDTTVKISAEGKITEAKGLSVAEKKQAIIDNEYNLTLLKLKIETEINKARLTVLNAEMAVLHERKIKAYEEEKAVQIQAMGKKHPGMSEAEAELLVAKDLPDPGEYLGSPIQEALKSAMDLSGPDGPLVKMAEDVAAAIKKGAEDAEDEIGKNLITEQRSEIISAAGQGDTTYERLANANKKGGIGAIEDTTGRISAINEAMQPMIDNLRSLGPDGELVAAVAQGALIVGESWSNVGDILGDTTGKFSQMEKGAAIASAVAQTVSQIGNIMAAASQAKIAGIDKEIAAEKKRDGKSKESVAKIKALEAKKEAMKRKAFEQNKKMQMASVVASTAAAIMGVVSGVKSFWEAPMAIAMAAMFAGMGAAQLAVIAGTSYQGGGSSAGASVPSTVSVGKRKDSVDVAKSKSAKGELAYFRGASGYGGPENFRSAFTGVKHRASGGNTGYIVGEQGPELFMPDRPGTIVPSDDVSVAGGATNVTFSINTVDATGVEELLEEQQGNIIGMIRQAANSYGQEFMEDIDTTPLNLSRVGRA